MPSLSDTAPVSSIKMNCAAVTARLAVYERARRSWKAVELSFDQFAAHLDRLGWEHSLPEYSEALYLGAACTLAIEPACVALERTYFSGLRAALSRQRESWDFIEEVLQRTRERLLVGPRARIGTYRGDGPLPAWLLVVARRLALDLRRGDGRYRRLVSLEPQHCESEAVSLDAMRPGDGHRALDAVWIGHVEATIRLAMASLDSQDRQLLHLHYVEHRNAAQIGHALGIDRATVYRRLRRSENNVACSVRREMQASLGGRDRDGIEELLRASYATVSLDDYFSLPALEGPTRPIHARRDECPRSPSEMLA